MARKDYESKTESLITPILERFNFELVDVEFVKEGSDYYLRVYIDKEGGITSDDCADVSREFNVILDEEDYISESYIFEVSSPGLTRPLKKDRDFKRNLGKAVEVKLYKAIDKVKEFEGELVAFDEDTITIATDSVRLTFKRDDIALVRLSIEW